MGGRRHSVLVLILVLGGFLAEPVWADPGRLVGKIVKIEGRVDVTPPGDQARPARPGHAVRVGDVLRSKSRARAEVLFTDGSIMRMAETSRVEITRYMVSEGRTDGMLHLFRGKIETIVQKSKGLFGFGKKNRFEVHTKNAVCGVRGTDYFSAYVNGTSDFIFKEGSGYGFNKNDPDRVAHVSAGQALQVAGVNRPPQVRPASQAELDAHSADTESDEENGDDGDAGQADTDPGSNEDTEEGSADRGDDGNRDGGDAGVAESGGTDSDGDGVFSGSEPLGTDGYFTTGDGAGLYADGAVPGPEIFSDAIFSADGSFADDAMPMLMDIFGPDSMMTTPVIPWEQDRVNEWMTTAYSVAGSLAGGFQVKLYGTWDPDLWTPPTSYIDMVEGALDATHQIFITPGGFWYDGAVEGGVTGLWVGADGGAGLLIGDMTGTYGADGTWETAYFSTTSIQMAAAGAAAFNAADPLPDPKPIIYEYSDNVGRNFDSGTGVITVLNPDGQLIGGWIGIPDQDWGIFRGEINGTFTDGVTDGWHIAFTGVTDAGGFDNIQWVEIEGAQWSGAEIRGSATGAWVDLDQAVTGVLGGPVAGVFDPADPKQIWDLVIGGTWISTERFLAMAGKIAGTPDTAALDAMGIPRFEVGRTDFTGNNGNLAVQINDMIFFSHAAAQRPAIWASGSVTGQYTANPVTGAEVLLNGVGFNNVNFKVERWDGMGGKWGAEITGAGQVGGYNVTVVGGAAGDVNAAASFTGTAAGVAGNAAALVAQ
ncbi:MAG: FecR domain-containing protein [Desulfobacterales bacterium]|nr:FecR domain-containing protein [Desulfobacterales bacterium]